MKKMRLIDANALYDELLDIAKPYERDNRKTCTFKDCIEFFENLIYVTPTIDAVPMDFHERCIQSVIKKKIAAEKTNRQILENYVPVVHGKFEKQPEEIIPNLHVCPVLCKTCGTVYFTLNKSGMKELFCPYCGAKKDIGGQSDG